MSAFLRCWWVYARSPTPARARHLHRPGAATDWPVVALGLGFSPFVALAVINTSLSSEIHNAAPIKAPRFFVMDLQPQDAARFRTLISAVASTLGIGMASSLSTLSVRPAASLREA